MKKHNTRTSAKQDKPKKRTMREIQELASQVQLTVGLDLGDRGSHYCIVDAESNTLMEGKVATTKTGFNAVFEPLGKLRIALEAGTHSPWVSRHLSSLGHEVIVANPRRVAMIGESKHKNDRVDAGKLAWLAQANPKLLFPIQHREEQTQLDLAQIRMREELVKLRTSAINAARGQAKALGYRLEDCDTDNAGLKLAEKLPEAAQKVLNPLLDTAAQLTAQIKAAEREIHLVAKRYGEIELLTAIYGVGELTALAFVLTIDDKERFDKSREVGPYLGIVPGQNQSGESNPQQRITKEGDRMLRWLLVQCAHCILKTGAPDSDLRRWGLKKLQEQANGKGKPNKKKVLVGVARKLAVLMHRLWACGEVYDPLYNAKRQEALANKTAA